LILSDAHGVKKEVAMKRKKILILFLTFLFASSLVFAEPENNPRTKVVVDGNSSFALALYDNLRKEKGNLFLSSYSISTALAMTYAGARGNTAAQMADVLCFTLSQEQLHPAFADLQAQLNEVQAKGNIELNVANALWAQEGYSFLSDFLGLTDRYYEAALFHVNFERNTESARLEINAWVEQRTKDKIKELIKQGLLNSFTRLVLTNAIYFKGDWLSQFEKDLTKQALFWLSSDNSIKVPMMTQRGKFGYMQDSNLQILELPYSGNDLSMIILLPKRKDDLAQVEEALNERNLNLWTQHLKTKEVIVFLPRFKMTSEFSLAETLVLMGMTDAFDRSADFSGMTGKKDLYISKVIHKAFIAVDEEGTEAAAATAVVMKRLSASNEEPTVIFRADHPFIFLIRHNPSGSILFFGRVIDPTE